MNQPFNSVDTLPDRINCLVLSLSDRKILVPSTAVAEVLSSVERPAGHSDGFCYGWINWRERRIPLVSLEAFFGGETPALGRVNRLAVFNTIDGAVEPGFFAARLDTLPQSLPVAPHTAAFADDVEDDALLMEVSLGPLRLAVPRLDRIEQRVALLEAS